MKNKDNVLSDFLDMIFVSWTWERLNADEKSRYIELMNSNIIKKDALKGDYRTRWNILNGLYAAYLGALDYNPTGWRETKTKKLIDLTSKFENKFNGNENCKKTNVGYKVDDVDYVFGEYVLNRSITKDVDNDDILSNVLYVYNGNDEYHKIDEEDIPLGGLK